MEMHSSAAMGIRRQPSLPRMQRIEPSVTMLSVSVFENFKHTYRHIYMLSLEQIDDTLTEKSNKTLKVY